MEEDAGTPGFTRRAACRWVTYMLLWSTTFSVALVSAYHPVLRIITVVMGCVLAVSLPVLFATLFEITYIRRARSDLPIICFPWLGSIIVLVGILALLQASSLLVTLLISNDVDSAHTLSALYAGKVGEEMPRSVCIHRAFVKTDWEAGKLRCEGVDGHVQCAPAFVAAPIFDDKVLSDAGLSEEIFAWAVTQGNHVDANYRRDGSLCGYLTGRMELDYHISDYRLAVTRVIQKHKLRLGRFAGNSEAGSGGKTTPLEGRPLFLTADPLEVSHVEQALLAVGFILLCCCPCAGPAPVGGILLFACWARQGRASRYGQVSTDDYDEDSHEAEYGVPGRGRRGGNGV